MAPNTIDDVNLSPEYMKAICILSGIFCLFSLIINLSTIVKHASNLLVFPIQKLLLLLNILNCFCAIYFFLGVILYPFYEFFELMISIHIAGKMGIFYNGIIKLIIAYEIKLNEGRFKDAIEALQQEDPKMFEYYKKEEIKNKFSLKRVYLLIMIVQMKVYKNLRCYSCCCKHSDLSTYKKAVNRMKLWDLTMLCFVLANTIVPIINIILRQRGMNHDNRVFLILKIVKLVPTIFGMLTLNNFTSNLSPMLLEHRPSAKFRILQILFLLINLQGVILGWIQPETNEFKKDYFAIIVLYLFLSFENIFVALYVKVLFGLGDALKARLQQYSGALRLTSKEDEATKINV